MIRVLIAEDSAVIRELLVCTLAEDPALQVVGIAQNGLEATEQARQLRPDIIVMDVYMPRMNGFEAARQIMEQAPTPIVMMSARFDHDEVALTFQALEAGALSVVDKPRGLAHPGYAESVRRLVETVKLMAEVKVVRRWPKRARVTPSASPHSPLDRPLRLIAIGASTGGPQVIEEILAALPGSLVVPLLVVQHIAPGFTRGLVTWLNQRTSLTVKLAEPGETVSAGVVYVAPDGVQMGVTPRGRLCLSQEGTVEGFCPSVSYVFKSVAHAYGRSAMGVLLTGMGCDGAQGLRRLREAGGVTIVQNRETSVVFGMPGEAIRLGAAEHVLSPAQIVAMIRSLRGG